MPPNQKALCPKSEHTSSSVAWKMCNQHLKSVHHVHNKEELENALSGQTHIERVVQGRIGVELDVYAPRTGMYNKCCDALAKFIAR